MKRALTALLTLMLCASLLLLSPSLAEDLKPEPFMSGDYRHILLEDGTAEITRYNGKTPILVIPSTLDGHSVTSIGDEAFLGCPSLTITVGRDSYAKQYCIDNDIKYMYFDSLDWLNS